MWIPRVHSRRGAHAPFRGKETGWSLWIARERPQCRPATRNSFSSSMISSTRISLGRCTTDKHAPLRHATVQVIDAMLPQRSGRCSIEPLHAALEAGQAIDHRPAPALSTANNGIRPTMERTRKRLLAAVREAQPVVIKAVVVVPQAADRPPDSWRRRCRGSARRTCWRCLRRRDRAASKSIAILQHRQAVHGHPSGAVGLFDVAAGGQRLAAVEDADVVEPQEAAFEDVVAFASPCGSPTR